MELKCVKVYTGEVQSHFSPCAAIRYRYYRCLRSTLTRFNLTPLEDRRCRSCYVPRFVYIRTRPFVVAEQRNDNQNRR